MKALAAVIAVSTFIFVFVVTLILLIDSVFKDETRCVDGKVQFKQNNYWVIDQTKACVEK